MDLPRNAYARHCARKAGHFAHRFGPDARMYDDEDSWYWHCRARRWQTAWWCPVQVGLAVDAGRLTLRAFAMAFLGSVFISGLFGGALIGACIGIYGIMYIGSKVLP